MTETRNTLDDLSALNDPELFAVYGTLRTDCGNDRIWQGFAESWGTDTVHQFRMTTNGGFPYAIPDEDAGTIVVELIHPHPEYRDVIRHRMDRLEGVPDHYIRMVVITDEGNAAWLYTPTEPSYASRLERVPSGDWLDYRAARARRSGGW